METCTGDLAKAYTNKDYQEKEERYNMKNKNQCILWSIQWVSEFHSYRKWHPIIKKIKEGVSCSDLLLGMHA